jgi:acyl homoserine lactone synthase
MSDAQRTAMFGLRYDTFVKRLGWEVKTDGAGLEIDEFDRHDTAKYIVATTGECEVAACWRLLPTLGPNMLRDVFPVLLHGKAAPAAVDTWELSRFAIARGQLMAGGPPHGPRPGLGPLPIALMRESVAFARRNGIARYITVTTRPLERSLRRLGLHVRRVGPPVRIGNVQAVACYVEADDRTAAALGM